MKNSLQSLVNIGPAIELKLIDIGVNSAKKLQASSPEEIFMKYFQKHGWTEGMCSCFLYTLEGAKTNTKWNLIPEKRKKELVSFVHKVRKSF